MSPDELMEDLNERIENKLKRPSPYAVDSTHNTITPEGLIVPRKPVNPCLLSADRQNLHRELLFNEKIGKNVLNQKTELQKAWQKHKEHQTKMEDVRAKLESKSPLERVIEERARRLESMEALNKERQSSESQPEFIRVHAKLCANKLEPK